MSVGEQIAAVVISVFVGAAVLAFFVGIFAEDIAAAVKAWRRRD